MNNAHRATISWFLDDFQPIKLDIEYQSALTEKELKHLQYLSGLNEQGTSVDYFLLYSLEHRVPNMNIDFWIQVIICTLLERSDPVMHSKFYASNLSMT